MRKVLPGQRRKDYREQADARQHRGPVGMASIEEGPLAVNDRSHEEGDDDEGEVRQSEHAEEAEKQGVARHGQHQRGEAELDGLSWFHAMFCGRGVSLVSRRSACGTGACAPTRSKREKLAAARNRRLTSDRRAQSAREVVVGPGGMV